MSDLQVTTDNFKRLSPTLACRCSTMHRVSAKGAEMSIEVQRIKTNRDKQRFSLAFFECSARRATTLVCDSTAPSLLAEKFEAGSANVRQLCAFLIRAHDTGFALKPPHVSRSPMSCIATQEGSEKITMLFGANDASAQLNTPRTIRLNRWLSALDRLLQSSRDTCPHR